MGKKVHVVHVVKWVHEDDPYHLIHLLYPFYLMNLSINPIAWV